MDKKATVLAVDDNHVVLAKLSGLLKKHYTFVPALGGKAALTYLSANTPDIILLDCEMPDVNGFDVLASVKGEPRTASIPVLFLTGSIDTNTETKALEFGAVDYITKPFQDAVLLGRLRTHLELQELRRNLENLVEEKTQEVIRKSNEIEEHNRLVCDLLANVTDFRDKTTGGHSMRTGHYVEAFTNEMLRTPLQDREITEEDAELMVSAAKLHDIGKIAIPDEILLKRGPLTEDEFAVIKSHTTIGAEILDQAFANKQETMLHQVTREMILTHQEKWNGRGYPASLSGTDIPLSGRIMSICDVYDALSSKRSYKPAMTHEETCALILGESGVGFDPVLLTVFEKCMPEFRRLHEELHRHDTNQD